MATHQVSLTLKSARTHCSCHVLHVGSKPQQEDPPNTTRHSGAPSGDSIKDCEMAQSHPQGQLENSDLSEKEQARQWVGTRWQLTQCN